MQQKNPWTIKDSKAIYQNAWIDVTEFDVLNPAGKPGIYGKVHFKNIAVGVVPITPDMHTYLVGQYRFTIDAYSWEIPEGGCPEGDGAFTNGHSGIKRGNWPCGSKV
jgi:hypothetical protein